MKMVKVIEKEELAVTVVKTGATLELTWEELQLITAAVGCTSTKQRNDSIDYNFSAKPLHDKTDLAYKLYKQLRDLVHDNQP